MCGSRNILTDPVLAGEATIDLQNICSQRSNMAEPFTGLLQYDQFSLKPEVANGLINRVVIISLIMDQD